jgi:phytoene desaturase
MEEQKLIIIGAGIAGLSAAYYAQKSGFKVEVFEQHDKPGGLCTSWTRNGYTFDGCIHWLVGTNPGSEFYKLWHEIGAFDNTKILHPDSFTKVEDEEGHHLTLYSDIKRLEKHLIELFPEDAPMIRQTMRKIRKQTGFSFHLGKPPQLYKLGDAVKMFFQMLPHMKNYRDCMSISMKDYMNKFKNPFLREALIETFGEKAVLQAMTGIMAWYSEHNAGYPEGGSLAFARSIAKKLHSKGVKIHYNSPVDKIIARHGNCSGIILKDCIQVKGDIILSAADGYTTIYQLLEENYITKEIEDLYSRHTSPTCVQVSFGINDMCQSIPRSLVHIFKTPVTLGGTEINHVLIKNYDFDKKLHPRGKSVIVFIINAEYDYWEKISYGSDDYKKAKDDMAAFAINILNEKCPGIEKKIEVTDVATPLTFQRYTSSWRGSFMSWMGGVKEKLPTHPHKLPGLTNFYMASQWTMPPGGLPNALLAGKWIIQIIEHDIAKKH